MEEERRETAVNLSLHDRRGLSLLSHERAVEQFAADSLKEIRTKEETGEGNGNDDDGDGDSVMMMVVVVVVMEMVVMKEEKKKKRRKFRWARAKREVIVVEDGKYAGVLPQHWGGQERHYRFKPDTCPLALLVPSHVTSSICHLRLRVPNPDLKIAKTSS
jgi:hypothetical protein